MENIFWYSHIQKVNYQIILNASHYVQFYAKPNALVNFLSFSDVSLGHIMLTNAQNKSR